MQAYQEWKRRVFLGVDVMGSDDDASFLPPNSTNSTTSEQRPRGPINSCPSLQLLQVVSGCRLNMSALGGPHYGPTVYLFTSPDFVGAQCPHGAQQLVWLRFEIESVSFTFRILGPRISIELHCPPSRPKDGYQRPLRFGPLRSSQ